MAIERQTPDPAQEVEDMQDMTTERPTEDIDNEIIEMFRRLRRRRGQNIKRTVQLFWVAKKKWKTLALAKT